jgi:phosphoserine phosphatase
MKKDTYIFDLDGTLSDCEHRKVMEIKNGIPKMNWFQFNRNVDKDLPIQNIIKLFKHLRGNDVEILIYTGRYDNHKKVTLEWLAKYGVVVDKIRMRKVGDSRADTVLKKTWLDEDFGDDYSNLVCAFEDRNKMVDFYRSIGITCLQVATSDI